MAEYCEYFFGNKVSDCALESGYLDYGTLSQAFDHVLCNSIMGISDDWELVNGSEYDEADGTYMEIYQYYIITEMGYEILHDYTNEIVFYSEEYNMYVWGVTHYGTGWDCVLTDIRLEKRN